MDITDQFLRLKKELNLSDEVTSRILLAEVMDSSLTLLCRRLEDFDHQICMGVRFGLFGSDAPNNSSIESLSPLE